MFPVLTLIDHIGLPVSKMIVDQRSSKYTVKCRSVKLPISQHRFSSTKNEPRFSNFFPN